MTADGHRPENWQWLEVLTEPHPSRTDSRGNRRRIGRDPMAIPVETLTASGHGPREARRVIAALGDEPIDPSIRRLTECASTALAAPRTRQRFAAARSSTARCGSTAQEGTRITRSAASTPSRRSPHEHRAANPHMLHGPTRRRRLQSQLRRTR